MENRSKRKNLVATPQDEQDAADPIKEIQQQLGAIEKKLDILINRSPERSSEKSYSQDSSRGFDHSHRHDRGRGDSYPRERTYTRVICAECHKECEIPFKPSGDRPVYCKECFAKRKQGNPPNPSWDVKPKEGYFPREGRSDKRRVEIRQSPIRKKRISSVRRKKR